MTQDPVAFAFFNEIGIIDQLASNLFVERLPKGMSIAQFTVLNHFMRLGIAEKSPAALASAFQVTRPTMSSTLARMEKSGLIAIRADASDGRAKLVSLTEAGRAMRERCVAAIMPIGPMVAAFASDDELASLLPALRKIRAGLDKLRD
jgi:DNA-binding MarR family transcriptional regulator